MTLREKIQMTKKLIEDYKNWIYSVRGYRREVPSELESTLSSLRYALGKAVEDRKEIEI